MIKLFKFEDSTLYTLNSSVLTPTGQNHLDYSFQHSYNNNHKLIVPIPKQVSVTSHSIRKNAGFINVNNMISQDVDITFDDKIYVHSSCIIPRAKITQKYTRVLKPEKADICVVPKFTDKIEVEKTAIFINKNKNKVFIAPPTTAWINHRYTTVSPLDGKDCEVGTPLLTICPFLKNTTIKEQNYYGVPSGTYSMENWNDFLNSTLLYIGYTATLHSKEFWIADLLYNKLHDVITEDTILATLGDEANEFTKEIYDNLKQMLESSDTTVVGLGLKTLAEMNYEKYHNTVVHLLCNCGPKWCRSDVRSNSSVKYMLNYLNMWRSTYESYKTSTTPEDFELMKDVVTADFVSRIQSVQEAFKSRFPFASVSLDYSFSINPNTNDIFTDSVE